MHTRTYRHVTRGVELSFALLVVIVITGCGFVNHAPVAQNDAEIWASLEHRPLHLPVLKAGAPCPLASAHQVSPTLGAALGDGPVYPAGLGSASTLVYAEADAFGGGGSEWGGQKVIWIVSPTYQGPVLVRGGRLDVPGALRFNGGACAKYFQW
jgi:hypothetical protein